MASSINSDRIDIRLTPEEKALFLKAKELIHESSISSFIKNIVSKRAKEIIEENNQILASERDKEIFFDAIFNPSAPNEALKNAFAIYKNSMQ
jgi:uncharacterized protein (DUF1778 family)